MTAMLRQEGFKEDTKNEPGQIHVEKYWQWALRENGKRWRYPFQL